MEGQEQQQNSDVHTELDLAIASPGDFSLMLQDLGDDLDGMLELGVNTNMGNTGGTSSAAAEQGNNDNQGRAEWPRRRHNREQILQLEAYTINY
jgi:hypothetical protein